MLPRCSRRAVLATHVVLAMLLAARVWPAAPGRTAKVASLTSRPPAKAAVRKPSPAKKIIIIDPGHGGHNRGAISKITVGGRRVVEKDVNLKVALALKRLINASPDMEAYLTRETDKYLSLTDRVRFFANLKERHRRNGRPNFQGDLFISLHCNAGGRAGARGLEMFYLSPDRADSATNYMAGLSLAGGGRSILTALRGENFGEQNIAKSRRLCVNLQSACLKMSHYRTNNDRERPVQSRYFCVLRQLNMPAVLVEMGFLTNPADCRALATPTFQNQVAAALYNGVGAYFKSQGR